MSVPLTTPVRHFIALQGAVRKGAVLHFVYGTPQPTSQGGRPKKLTQEKIQEAHRLLQRWPTISHSRLARKLGVSRRTLARWLPR